MANNLKIAVIGLGYVGLPLTHAFGFKYKTIGFDIATKRIDELNKGIDKTLELSKEQVKECLDNDIIFTNNLTDIANYCVYIITVPTPVDEFNKPDLSPLLSASEAIGSILKKDDIVIYESTVYPGATEDFCVPILERESGLIFNKDFYCGYSPERINPGDKEHTVSKILKVTSGSTPEIAQKIDTLYGSIITAGTHLAPSIKVAEAAKIIENTQRDINIAFVNELSMLFNKMGIDTKAVLAAARTKWNFLPFEPGLVGGHCIGVDPYYLTYKAGELGYHPEIILAGRRINDGMGLFVASSIIKLINQQNIAVVHPKILILGITFKENCPDIRNSKVIDVIKELEDFGSEVTIYDPNVDKQEVLAEYNITLLNKLTKQDYQAVVLAVNHHQFADIDYNNLVQNADDAVFYSIKHTDLDIFKFGL